MNEPHPSTSGIRNVVGSTIWQRLQTNHLLLPSPRRVGKTSLMRSLVPEAGAHGFAGAIYVDIAGAADEREFVAKFAAALASHPAAQSIVRTLRPGPLARWLARIQSITAGSVGLGLTEEREKTWKQLGDEFVAALRNHGGRWLILCDELGIFVQTLLRRERGDTNRARAFLTWLRDDVRQGGGDAEAGARVRWLVASSVGLPTLTDLNRIGDTINDFELVPIGPFAPDVADLFLAELAHGRRLVLEPAVRRRIVTKVGWPIPYFLQVFFAALVEGRDTVTVEHVDATFERLLGIDYRPYFDWWSQRLVEELGRQRGYQARTVLTACARRPEGVRADTLRNLLAEHKTPTSDLDWAQGALLDILESDGYWVRDGEHYRFRSNLLREYWLRRHAR